MLSFFPRDVLDGILNLIESVSEEFPSYSYTSRHYKSQGCTLCSKSINGPMYGPHSIGPRRAVFGRGEGRVLVFGGLSLTHMIISCRDLVGSHRKVVQT